MISFRRNIIHVKELRDKLRLRNWKHVMIICQKRKRKEQNCNFCMHACMKKWRRLIMMQKVAAFAFNPSNSFVESCLYFPLFSIHFVRCNPSFSVSVWRIKPRYGPIALLLGHICHVFSLSLIPNQLLGFKERER